MENGGDRPFDDVVKGRRSIRGFRADPLPRALVAEIVEIAMRAPSSFNTQPWNFHAVAGDPLDRIRAENTARNEAGVPSSREVRRVDYGGVHKVRQIEIAKQIFAAMEIDRYDEPKRKEWVRRGYRQFDAPVSVVVTYDRVVHGSDIAPFDCGAVTNALVTAAWSRGVGCVINSQGIMQSPVVREYARIPDDQVIMICVAMGFPDESFAANSVLSTRRSVEEALTFVGFE